MSEPVNDYIPGKSLFAEITTLREEMEALRKGMVQLVDLQRDIHIKLDAVLNSHIKEEEATWPANLNSN